MLLARIAVLHRERLADVLVGDHLAGGIEPDAAAVDGSGSLRVPRQRFMAHVLPPHRPAEMLRQQRGLGGGVALAVAGVAAGAEHPDRPHLLARQPQELGDAVGAIVRLLGAGPYGGAAVAHIGDRAGGPHAGMRLGRIFVFAFDDAHRLLEAILHRAVVALGREPDDAGIGGTGDDRRLADVIVELVVAGEVRLRPRPGHLQGLRRLDGVPFLLGHRGQEVLDPDHLGARNIADRLFVDRDRHRARDGGADHAGMQHAGQPDIAALLQRAEHLAGHVAARHRLADDLELGWLLERRLYLDGELLGHAVPGDGRIQIAAADEFGVSDALARIGARVGTRMHHAVRHREIGRRYVQSLARHLDQQAARLRGGPPHDEAALPQPVAGGGAAHVDGQGAVAHDDAHALPWHVDLFGYELRNRGFQALAAVDLAVVRDHGAFRIDRDVGP